MDGVSRSGDREGGGADRIGAAAPTGAAHLFRGELLILAELGLELLPAELELESNSPAISRAHSSCFNSRRVVFITEERGRTSSVSQTIFS